MAIEWEDGVTPEADDDNLDDVKMIAADDAGDPILVPAAPIISRAVADAIAAIPAVDWTATINAIVDAKIAAALEDVPLTTGLAVGRYEFEVLADSEQWVPASPASGTPPAAPTIDDVETDNVVSVAESANGVVISGTAEIASTVSVAWGGINKATTADGSGDWTVTYSVEEIPSAGTRPVTASASNGDGTGPTTSLSVTVEGEFQYGAETTLNNFLIRSDPSATKPGYLASITDSLTGFDVFRISDRTTMSGGRVLKHRYAKLCPFTADGSKIWLNASTSGDNPVIDADTLAYLNKRSYGDQAFLSKSESTPDRFYTMAHNGSVFTSFCYQNLADASGSFTSNEIRDFEADGYNNVNIGGYEGSQSVDDRYWPMQGTKTSDGTVDFFIYDKTDNTLSTRFNVPAASAENCQMSPDGSFMVVCLTGSGGGKSAGVHVFNSSMVWERVLSATPGNHGDIAYDTDGNLRWVWPEIPASNTATLRSARLSDGSERVEITAQFASQVHVSATCYRRPGYILISSYDTDPTNYKKRGWNEAYFVKLDGTGTIERVSYVYHPSTGGGTYESQAWAASDPDGYQVVFASCWWNGTSAGNIESFLARKTGSVAPPTNLASNGTFDSSTGWSFEGAAGWAITGGQAVMAAPAGDNAWIVQPGVFTSGTEYNVTATVTRSAGSITIDSGVTTPVTASGTLDQTFTATETALYILASGDFVGTIDNVVVTET
jgi:hypothetical protein